MKRSNRSHRRQALLTWFAVALLVLLQVQIIPQFSVTQQAAIASTDKSTVQAQYANLPLVFEPNRGQADGSVSYLVHHGQSTTYFDGLNTTTTFGNDHITMSLDGANTPSFTGSDELESKTNYFIGNDQSKWYSDIPNYKQLLAQNVYPGIDIKYYGTNSQLEHDFIVNPGADPKQIAFHFDGLQDLSLDKDRNLVFKTTKDEIRLNAPTTYQQDAHSKHTISSQFELNGNTVTVAVNSDYDHSQPLIIDPTLTLVYSTYLGGSGNDQGWGIAVDSSGSAFVTGYTDSTNFPTSSPLQISNGGGGSDAFITKLNAAGSGLAYSSYLGGSGTDSGWGIAVDNSGNAYVTGITSSTNFPTSSPLQGSNAAGAFDAFVAKLNAAGSALTYSTYLGGIGTEQGYGIAVDSNNNAYVTGFTSSASTFPTASPFQAANGGVGNDAFVAKLNAAGSALTYSTYLGGSGTDFGYDIAVDGNNNAYVVGYTNSTNFSTASPFQAANAGGNDAFITKLNAAGSALTYSTYLGGSGTDQAYGIDIDTSGNVYLTGDTTSTNFPTSSPFQVSNGGGGNPDAFVTKLNAAGSALTYSTYLGGSGTDQGEDIVVDKSGSSYLIGYTNSTNFPTSSPIQGVYNGGGNDVFVTKMNAAGSALTYSTYLGGGNWDQGYGIAVHTNGDAYIVGLTASAAFPTKSPLQASNAGGAFDAFVTQLTEHNVNLTATVNPTLTFTVGSTSCSLGVLSVSQTQFCTYALTAATNGANGYTISYKPVATLTSGINTITALSSLTASTLGVEQFGINLRANTAVGSHTAGNFGADVSGGSGTVTSAYNIANSFKLAVAGDTIAMAASPSLTSTYTVSTIANITNTTEAGNYTTTLTYNIVSGY